MRRRKRGNDAASAAAVPAGDDAASADAGPDGDLRFAATLALALVLWLPTVRNLVEGAVSIARALTILALALAAAWVGVAAVATLVGMFARSNATAARQPRPPAATVAPVVTTDGPPRRRSTDPPPRS